MKMVKEAKAASQAMVMVETSAKNAVLRETEGSGLGLYITKNIVKHHKGTVRFESQEGTGSTFTIQLPVS